MQRHPRLELTAVTARSDAGRRLDHIYPRYRVAMELEVFDVYHGEQVGEGSTSLALRLEFRAPDRTLTDEEVAPLREKIVAAVHDKLEGELRG